MMFQKILVTGGRGFLGRYVVKELSKNPKFQVTILTHSPNSLEESVQKNVSYMMVDIRDEKKILEKVRDFDRVYHIAGNIRTKDTNIPELYYSINAKGTLNLLQACDENKIKRFIFISTCEVYGDKSKLNIMEGERKEPSNNYAASKLLAEKCCEEFSKDIKLTIIRPSYIYGHGQPKERLFPKLIKSAVEDEKIDLNPDQGGYDFVYVKDVAKGIVLLGKKEQENNLEYFNLSSGRFFSLRKIFDIVSELTCKEYKRPQIMESEGKRFSLSIEKAREQGYYPKYSLKEGLADFIKCYKKNTKS